MSSAKFGGAGICAVAAASFSGSASSKVVGADAAACVSGSRVPAVLVRVTGFRKRTGNLRVQAYGASPSHFLAKGKWVKRVDLPVTPAGVVDVCLRLPRPGRYAIAVRHDVDANGRSGWNDGGGFSRNPPLSLTRLKPPYSDVSITVGAQPRPMVIVLNYRRGLSIGPVR